MEQGRRGHGGRPHICLSLSFLAGSGCSCRRRETWLVCMITAAKIRTALPTGLSTNTETSLRYASAFYGPFREALDSNPLFGDKKTYQMDPGNYKEALVECHYDEAEGADILLVKVKTSHAIFGCYTASLWYIPATNCCISGQQMIWR